jgi:hypothetical protein
VRCLNTPTVAPPAIAEVYVELAVTWRRFADELERAKLSTESPPDVRTMSDAPQKFAEECWTKGPIHFQGSRQQGQDRSVLGEATGRRDEPLSKPKRYPMASNRKDDNMTRLLVFMVVALATGVIPVLAADTATQTTPPTENNVPPEASKSATVPPSGGADTSGGATEQSASPPSAGSTMGKMGEQSSSPPSAPSPSGKMGETPTETTPNPTAPSSGD